MAATCYGGEYSSEDRDSTDYDTKNKGVDMDNFNGKKYCGKAII